MFGSINCSPARKFRWTIPGEVKHTYHCGFCQSSISSKRAALAQNSRNAPALFLTFDLKDTNYFFDITMFVEAAIRFPFFNKMKIQDMHKLLKNFEIRLVADVTFKEPGKHKLLCLRINLASFVVK